MTFKETYATAYDALYQDKDYEKECDFIEAIFKKYKCKPKTILDLGCGTGGHALILAKRGYKVTGIDRSSSMLEIARKKAEWAGLVIEFIEGDITGVSLNRKFDAVISMFAVMSYQTTNDAIAKVCKLAKESLVPGGLFIFDCWHGFAVLSDRPTPRIKEISMPPSIHLPSETESQVIPSPLVGEGQSLPRTCFGGGGKFANEKIIRFTQPELDIINHIVYVNFRVLRISLSCHPDPELVSGEVSQVKETFESHPMRFLFPQEIKYFLEVAGFEKVDFYPFLEIDREGLEYDGCGEIK
ncbi:MAG: class I SAM-dependent methyltransferase [Thermodesulfovibrionales bacterium]|nr:class I SAM-dependent methyltransferase [Thermodesulfovibrionales bacterium]